MKKQVFLLFCFLIVLVDTSCNYQKKPIVTTAPAEGTAILITGAAARIPQEAALLENLFQKDQLNQVDFIAGASSGALNAVVLNGILSKKITWNQYIRWLGEITNDSIFNNPNKKLPVDTNPMRKYLTRIINDSLGYHKMKDLPISTALSITALNAINIPQKNYRLSNHKINSESDPELDIVDVLMASTAFPVVFPEQKIEHASTLPDKYFVDGGLGKDHVPYSGLIDYIQFNKKSVKKVIIISRKSDLEPDINLELGAIGIGDIKIFDRLGISLDEFLQKGFLKGLREYEVQLPELTKNTFIYIPDFEEKFLLLNFNDLENQYLVTRSWALKNDPVPLYDYLKRFE